MVYVSTLAPEPYHLRRDIPISVEAVEDGYVASFVEANINASGETVNDAVANLKELLVTLFEHLEKIPEAKLGKMPRIQLGVLRDVICRCEQNDLASCTLSRDDWIAKLQA